MSEESKNLDLSLESFDEFVEIVFNRRPVSDEEQLDLFLSDLAGEHDDEIVPSSPAIIVSYMTRLLSEFGETTNRYSLPQLEAFGAS